MTKECWINVYEGYEGKPSHGATLTTRQAAINAANFLIRFSGCKLMYRIHVKLK